MRLVPFGFSALLVLAAVASSATGLSLGPGNFDQGWMREGFQVVFAGAGLSRGPMPPTPDDAWDPAGWTRTTATFTAVSEDVVTVQYETCLHLQDYPWAVPVERCSTTTVDYARATRESLDGTHCSVLWLTEVDYEICLGKGTGYILTADTTHASFYTAPLVEDIAFYVYDGVTGLLLSVADEGDLEVAQRVTPADAGAPGLPG